jgi:hypothetical protein
VFERFERYTEKAGRAIFFACREAKLFGSPQIESEHLLLGLFDEDKAIGNRFSTSPRSWESVRKQVEEHTTIKEKVPTLVDLLISGECQRILAYAAEEAASLSHKHVGTEHLLLGILREQGSFAAKLLNDRGISLESARAQLSAQAQLTSRPDVKSKPAALLHDRAVYRPQRLLYNAASGSLIQELHAAEASYLFPSRVFVRYKDSTAFEQIANPPQGVCYESPVTCETRPIVAFNSIRWKESEPGHWSTKWDGVYSFDLNSKELVLRLSDKNLRLDEPHLGTWITELVSLSEDAEQLYVKVGVEKALPNGCGAKHYFFASVRLSECKLTLLAPLMPVFLPAYRLAG